VFLDLPAGPQNGTPVAYLGKIKFVLCNINCGERGASMTLLKKTVFND
jgi:hypothetical protein